MTTPRSAEEIAREITESAKAGPSRFDSVWLQADIAAAIKAERATLTAALDDARRKALEEAARACRERSKKLGALQSDNYQDEVIRGELAMMADDLANEIRSLASQP